MTEAGPVGWETLDYDTLAPPAVARAAWRGEGGAAWRKAWAARYRARWGPGVALQEFAYRYCWFLYDTTAWEDPGTTVASRVVAAWGVALPPLAEVLRALAAGEAPRVGPGVEVLAAQVANVWDGASERLRSRLGAAVADHPALGPIARQDPRRSPVQAVLAALTATPDAEKLALLARALVEAGGQGLVSIPRSRFTREHRPLDPVAKGHYDVGHFLAHSAGGPAEVNYFLQVKRLNRGWSVAGARYRAMERLVAAHPGTLYFSTPLYRDDGSVPSAFDYGYLLPEADHWVVARFDNPPPTRVPTP